uniref:Uncharacterized protein n=1 Tax=viral metagenome TaxID=1070528 RepID=A0A6M3LFS2_9ZZZZ
MKLPYAYLLCTDEADIAPMCERNGVEPPVASIKDTLYYRVPLTHEEYDTAIRLRSERKNHPHNG